MYGMCLSGMSYTEIAHEVPKPDGFHPTAQTVANVQRQCENNGGLSWNGILAPKQAGRPRETTSSLDKQLLKIVYKYRGRSKVNVAFIRKHLRVARSVSPKTLQRRLREAGLSYLRRRGKSRVPTQHKAARLEWADWVLKRTAQTLSRWAYTDGTVFYLARTVSEADDKKRLALGRMVWRSTQGSDALYEDCVGPSAYAKAQGYMVRIWGLLISGVLFIYVLPENRL